MGDPGFWAVIGYDNGIETAILFDQTHSSLQHPMYRHHLNIEDQIVIKKSYFINNIRYPPPRF